RPATRKLSMKSSLRQLALCLSIVFLSVLGFAQTARALEEKAPASPRPPLQKLEGENNSVGLRLTLRPGVASVNNTITVQIDVAELLKNPHPTYGVRRPITDADLRAILVAPTPSKAKKGKKAKAPGAAVS